MHVRSSSARSASKKGPPSRRHMPTKSPLHHSKHFRSLPSFEHPSSLQLHEQQPRALLTLRLLHPVLPHSHSAPVAAAAPAPTPAAATVAAPPVEPHHLRQQHRKRQWHADSKQQRQQQLERQQQS